MSATFLGIDVGTTRTKAVLLEGDGHAVLAAAAAPTPQGDAGGIPVHSPGAVNASRLEPDLIGPDEVAELRAQADATSMSGASMGE